MEALPEVADDFSTRVPGLFIVGDLTGTPLLKFAIDSGTRVVRSMAQQSIPSADERVPLVIVGAGVAGLAAAMEAKRLGISFQLIESARPLDTLENFPLKKPIFTKPDTMVPAGELQLPGGDLDREGLIASLLEQSQRAGIESISGRVRAVNRDAGGLTVKLEDGTRIEASRVVIAIGRSGDHRKLGVAGEDLDHVSHRLHDPADHRGESVVVVGEEIPPARWRSTSPMPTQR